MLKPQRNGCETSHYSQRYGYPQKKRKALEKDLNVKKVWESVSVRENESVCHLCVCGR